MYIRGKKKNKISIDDDSSLERSSPIFASSFAIVKLVVENISLSNELYPSSKDTLSYKVHTKATYKKIAGGRKREREEKKGGRGKCTRKSLGFFKCKARALKIQAKPLHALSDRIEKFSFASRESGLHSSPRIHK